MGWDGHQPVDVLKQCWDCLQIAWCFCLVAGLCAGRAGEGNGAKSRQRARGRGEDARVDGNGNSGRGRRPFRRAPARGIALWRRPSQQSLQRFAASTISPGPPPPRRAAAADAAVPTPRQVPASRLSGRVERTPRTRRSAEEARCRHFCLQSAAWKAAPV
eukprot:363221-Chlamydomonas_euryale.AAC.31